MRRGIRNVIQVEVEGVSLEGATNLEFYVRQNRETCRIYTPKIVDSTHIEVNIPLEDAMELRASVANVQLAFTNSDGYPVATDVATLPIGDLLKEEGYDGSGITTFVDTADATVEAADILKDKTAYARGLKLVGTCSYNVDTSSDTVTADTLAEGATAHNSKGEIITGTMTSGDDTEFISLIETGNCSSLPAGLTKIRAYAFYVCSNLALTSLPSEITSVGAYAFYHCSSLALTSLPSGVTSIEAYTFDSCTNLKLTAIPDNIDFIGWRAFYDCTKLALTSLPAAITKIDGLAFGGCAGLTSLTFKGTPDAISSSAFNFCTNLTDIYVPWSEGAVANAPWGATNATIHYDSEV